jgi:glutamyl-tRNA synthetase
MTIRTRFAPSPTGMLHVGNIRTALNCWLWARKNAGECWLRIDDTDLVRSEERFVKGIRADLAWLGLDIDGEVRQSARFALYEARFDALRAAGRVYPCFETAQELDLKRKVRLSRGLPPVYDRAALSLSDEDRLALEAAGTQPHWRFKLDHEKLITWHDRVRGPQQFDPKLLSDPVIRRADGSWLYLLPSVIDDIDMAITDVIRGEDHVSNTATQIQMFEALGAQPRCFAHMALLTGVEGKLSKRLGSLGVDSFREAGLEPAAIAALLARIGTSLPVEPISAKDKLFTSFDFSTFGRAPARFDEAELASLNARIVHQLNHADVAERLPPAVTPEAWAVLRPNLSTVNEATDWVDVLAGAIPQPALNEDDRAFVDAAAASLAASEWTPDIWKAWTAGLKATTGRSGKALFLPLRLALTGRDHGPDMAALLPLIGKKRALERLASA